MPELPPPSIIDYIALVIICVSLIQGIFRGLSGELARFIGVIVSFITGITLYRPIGQWLSMNTRISGYGAMALAFISTIVVASVIMIIIRIS